MTWTFSAYQSTTLQTWRRSTYRMDSSWTGGLSHSFLAALFSAVKMLHIVEFKLKGGLSVLCFTKSLLGFQNVQ